VDDEPPEPGLIVDVLVRVRDAGEASVDPTAQYIGTEARVATDAARMAIEALARGEMLGGLQNLRLLAETAIRLRWIAFEGEERAGPDGLALVDPAIAAERVRRLRKRDLLQLAQAYRAFSNIRPEVGTVALLELMELAEQIHDEPAPRDTAQLITSRLAQNMYFSHRLCSALIHPGAALGRRELVTAEVLEMLVATAAYTAAGFGEAILRATFGESIFGPSSQLGI